MRRTDYRVGLSLQAGADNATSFLDFNIETLPGARAAACLDAPLAVVGRSFWFAPQLAADRFSLTCDADATFNDRVARFRIAERGLYRILTAQPDRGTRIAVRQSCADNATEIACELGGEIPALMLEPGEYSLVIDSPLNSIMGFTVTLFDSVEYLSGSQSNAKLLGDRPYPGEMTCSKIKCVRSFSRPASWAGPRSWGRGVR